MSAAVNPAAVNPAAVNPKDGQAWPSEQISLDGTWEFLPGDRPMTELAALPGTPITVPSLWEAEGYPGLDGVAWYRRRFRVADPAGWWTLGFGAVMDDAEVYLNGRFLGSHRGGFTPFWLACGDSIAAENEIVVKVTDHPPGSEAHLASAHGKQGWMNHVFPSPPSLYLTYGGIWQPVRLERHGPVRIADCWVNGDPGDLTVEVTTVGTADAEVRVSLLDRDLASQISPAAQADPLAFRFGEAAAPLWSPASPVLHDAVVEVYVGERLSHKRTVRFGLRTIAVGESSFLLNGEPLRMRGALVQGFSAKTRYGGISREEAVAEVKAAKAAGLNTLRLHIKAFDPVYLDVCDEFGMLVHCDIPIAEPIAYDLLGPDGPVTEQCVRAAVEQVRRDRGHPSIVLWSAMNELGAERQSIRTQPGYAGFARRLYAEVSAADPTRPVIENDWIEPDPEHVFDSPLITAHWYGRLSARYLNELRDKTWRWSATGRPLLLSEFGDWGLPDLDVPDTGPDTGAIAGDRPFWAYRDGLTALIEATPWPGSIAEFVEGTQHYQGVADRLQIEMFRQVPGLAGWCVTELTDVPQEFNGLLDIWRGPKEAALAEIRRATQLVCPVLVRPLWAVTTGGTLTGELAVINDGPAIPGAELVVELVGTATRSVELAESGGAATRKRLDLPAHAITNIGPVHLACPAYPADAALTLTVLERGIVVGVNQYPIRFLPAARVDVTVAAVASQSLRGWLCDAGATVADPGDAFPGRDLLLIGEGLLGPAETRLLDRWLADGGRALLLAQEADGSLPLPVNLTLTSLDTAWGSTPFIFTTAAGSLAALPLATVLSVELLSVAPEHVYTDIAGSPFAPQTIAGILKPPPNPLLATVAGRIPVGAGVLTVCQFPLTRNCAVGDPLAGALLADLLHLASSPSG